MTELLNSAEIARPPLGPDRQLMLGSTAVLEPTTNIRQEIIGTHTLETNLPAGDFFEPWEDQGWGDTPLSRPLVPSSLDELPAGEFFVAGQVEANPLMGMGVSYRQERSISIQEADGAKRLGVEALAKRPIVGPDMGPLMTELGFKMAGDEALEIPTPHTVQTAAQKLGVNIRLFDDQAFINGHDYLQTFSDGEYPVSTLAEKTYTHDIEDDHLTALVLGGPVLKGALQGAAERALSEANDIDGVAAGFDNFTATLRAIIKPHPEIAGEAYGTERGRHTLIQSGANIGVTAETVNDIIAQAQSRAADFGITPKQLQ